MYFIAKIKNKVFLKNEDLWRWWAAELREALFYKVFPELCRLSGCALFQGTLCKLGNRCFHSTLHILPPEWHLPHWWQQMVSPTSLPVLPSVCLLQQFGSLRRWCLPCFCACFMAYHNPHEAKPQDGNMEDTAQRTMAHLIIFTSHLSVNSCHWGYMWKPVAGTDPRHRMTGTWVSLESRIDKVERGVRLIQDRT